MNIRARRILVAEDEYMLALHLEDGLVRLGAGVIGPFATLAEVEAVLDSGVRPDGAVLDVNLGGECVFPVAERLRQMGVPFVFASGYDRAMLPAGFDDVPHCPKPVDVALVLRTLRL